MPTSPMLTVHDLHAGYGETDVLRGIDLTVNAGEVVAVLGSNGVGKSTLNRTISGILRARSGAIVFEGVDVVREKPAAIVARGLIHVPEGREFSPICLYATISTSAAIAAPAPTVRRTASVFSRYSRVSTNAARNAPIRCRAANNRCLRSAAVLWPSRD